MPRPLSSSLISLLRRYRDFYFRWLGPFALAVIALAFCAFLVESSHTPNPMRWDEALYSSLALFFFQTSRVGYPHDVALRLAHFLAPGIAASALFEAFLRLVEEKGGLYFGRLRGHVVVGGLGNLGATIARHRLAHGGALVAIERVESTAAVAELRASGAGVVLIGDMASDAMLERARTHEAAQVFFTAPSDVTNLDAAFRVRRLYHRLGRGKPPTIYTHVFDGALISSLEAQLLAPDDRGVRIVPWSSYRFAAKALVSELVRDRLVRAVRLSPELCLRRTSWPEGDRALEAPPVGAGPVRADFDVELDEDLRRLHLAFHLQRDLVGARASDGTGEERRDVAVASGSLALGGSDGDRHVIVGLGRFGRAVLRELLNVDAGRGRYLLVERSEAGYHESVAHFSDEERSRFELLLGDAVVPSSMARIVAFAPTAVIVCTDNDLRNLRLAVDLRHRELRAVTRMFDLEASPELHRGLSERGIAVVGLSRLFRAAIPILTHEHRLLACLNLDVAHTPEVDHLFYVARVGSDERARLGRGCLALGDLARDGAHWPEGSIPDDLSLVWHRSVPLLSSVAGAPLAPSSPLPRLAPRG